MESDYAHIEQFLGEGWDEDADLSGTLFGCIPRGKLEKFHIHVYRVAGMAELNVSAVDDERALEVAMDVAASGRLVFGQPDCNVVAVIPSGDSEE